MLVVLFCLGYPDQAMARVGAAIGEGCRLAHPASLATALGLAIKLLPFDGDNTVLNEWVDEMVATTADQGLAHWRAGTMIYHGWAKVKNDHVGEGISLLRNALTTYHATGAKVWVPHFLSYLAAAYEFASEVGDALWSLDDALQIVERTGERWFAAELNRHKGRLLLRQGHTEAAEELFRRALDIAREQEAKMWELRATASLAQLRRDQDHRTEARDILLPVYGWFTEGFDTPDLKDAKALLDDFA